MKAFIKNFIFIFLSATLFISCSKSNNAPETKKLDPLEIAITPEIQKQIKTETVSNQDVSETLMIPGRLEAQNLRLAKIGSPINGRVSDIFAGLEIGRAHV